MENKRSRESRVGLYYPAPGVQSVVGNKPAGFPRRRLLPMRRFGTPKPATADLYNTSSRVKVPD